MERSPGRVRGVAAAVLLACALPSAAGAQVVVVNMSADPAPDGTCALTPGDCTLREALTQDAALEVQVRTEPTTSTTPTS